MRICGYNGYCVKKCIALLTRKPFVSHFQLLLFVVCCLLLLLLLLLLLSVAHGGVEAGTGFGRR
jgi:hypothetical protein